MKGAIKTLTKEPIQHVTQICSVFNKSYLRNPTTVAVRNSLIDLTTRLDIMFAAL